MKNIDWKILKVLYEKRSITKAAESLFMTQSALTKRLQSIESEWGRQLVERTSRGVIFTDDGKYLVQKANIMLDFLQEIEDHFADRHTKTELLKLGVPNSFAKRHLPKLLAAYQKSGANLYIKTISNSSDVIFQSSPNTKQIPSPFSAISMAISKYGTCCFSWDLLCVWR